MPPRKKRKLEPVEVVSMPEKSKDDHETAGVEAALEPAPPLGQHESMSPGKIKVAKLMAVCAESERAWCACKSFVKRCSSNVKELKLLLLELKRVVRNAKNRPAYQAEMSEVVKFWEDEVQSAERLLRKCNIQEGHDRVGFITTGHKALAAHRKRLERKLRAAGVPF